MLDSATVPKRRGLVHHDCYRPEAWGPIQIQAFWSNMTHITSLWKTAPPFSPSFFSLLLLPRVCFARDSLSSHPIRLYHLVYWPWIRVTVPSKEGTKKEGRKRMKKDNERYVYLLMITFCNRIVAPKSWRGRVEGHVKPTGSKMSATVLLQ